MAVRDGARWLPDQLDSFCDQTHDDWSLTVGDDGSTDNSRDLISEFAYTHSGRSIRLLDGPRRGFQANFLDLLWQAPDHANFVAFSDQDDVWHPEKLETAIEALNRVLEGRPALYCGSTVIADEALRLVGHSPRFARLPSFSNALVQSIAGGNTMVINKAAIRLLQRAYNPDVIPVSHDWWVYQVVTGAGGSIFFDQTPLVTYRQHSENLVGSGKGLSGKLTRLRRLLAGEFREFSRVNISSLRAAKKEFTRENQIKLDVFSQGRERTLFIRLIGMYRAGIYRQTLMGSIALWVAIAARRI